jgi:hypothetical protein
LKEVYKLLNEAFLREGKKLPTENAFLKYYITPDGKILEIDFIMNPGSSLSPDEIFLIEETLKKQYTFKTDAGKLKDAKFLSFFWPLKFKDLK